MIIFLISLITIVIPLVVLIKDHERAMSEPSNPGKTKINVKGYHWSKWC